MSEVKIKQVIVVNTSLKMRRGKESAQAAHAAMEWLRQFILEGGAHSDLSMPQEEWLSNGQHAKVVVGVDSEVELISLYDQAIEAGVLVKSITDLGYTEFHGKPTLTCIAIGPDYSERIDPLTKHLKLR